MQSKGALDGELDLHIVSNISLYSVKANVQIA